ncbi:MAG: hypothetical protein ACON49_08970 [Candidatus Puniceispirillaceae bacterium]
MATKIGFADDLGVSAGQIMAFYKDNWTRKIALSDRAFHEWQFENTAENKGANSCVVAINEDGLLGVMGLNKRKFYLSEQRLNGAELTTWVVDQNKKGAGAGAKILNYITNRFDVLFGMGISQDALPIYMRCGFRYLRFIPRFIHVIDAKRILDISEHASYAPKLIRNAPAAPLTGAAQKILWKDEAQAPYIEGNHFSRSVEDLIWRYDNHPYFTYHTYKITGADGAIGYVVLREEITDKIKILHIIDILGPESCFEDAIKFAEFYAKDKGFWAVDAYSTLGRLNKYFNHRSWLSAVDSSYINVPHLFHPLEVRSPATTSLIYWVRDSNIDFFNVSDLYISKQDCDLDRPTMNFIGQTDG